MQDRIFGLKRFIETECVQRHDAWVYDNFFWEAYQDWCRLNAVIPSTKASGGIVLRALGFEPGQRTGKKLWFGVSLKTEQNTLDNLVEKTGMVPSEFMERYCVFEHSGRVAFDELYMSYSRLGGVPMNKVHFGRALSELGLQRYKNMVMGAKIKEIEAVNTLDDLNSEKQP